MNESANPEYFKAFRDAFEVVSFVCTPILAFLAWRALKQISVGIKQIEVTRDIAKTESKRESFRLATEQSERFAKEILPLDEKIQTLFVQKKLPDFQKVKVSESESSISIDWKNAPKWLEEVHENGHPIYDLANQLEGFSMWFTCRIADEIVAFRPCAVSYCRIVRRILPILVLSNKREKVFTHTLRLYTVWRNKLDMENNLAKQQELEKERKSLKVENIKPIGT